MTIDKRAELIVRNIAKMDKHKKAELLDWLRHVMLEVEQASEEYAPIARWSLME